MPTWFIVFANIVILGLLIALGFVFKELGWRFAVGVLVGISAIMIWLRIHHGKWF